MKLKRIGVWSFARIFALLGVVFGFIFGLIMGIMVVSIPLLAQTFGISGSAGTLRMLVYVPLNWAIFVGITNLITGAVTAAFYNLFAKFIGGIELNFVESKAKDKKK